MKLVTWNINGIRACKRPMKKILDELDGEIVCLQETKITRDTLDEPSAVIEGYNAYFSFSRKKSGYSGVANFCKDAVTPTGAEEGLSGLLTNHDEGRVGCYGNTAEFSTEQLQALDAEGRALMTRHQIQLGEGNIRDLTIINVYVPRAVDDDDRWVYKQRFLALLQCRAEALLHQGSHVIVLGDLNTIHKEIDTCDPTIQEFLRIHCRQWMNEMLREEDRDPDLPVIEDRKSHKTLTADAEGCHFMDAFRYFHPDRKEACTHWSTVTGARGTNFGKRLDYVFIDTGLKDYLVDCDIMPEFQGSDHCPMVLNLRCTPVPSKTFPPICARFMPEFQGKQQKLLSFFTPIGTAKSWAKQKAKEHESEDGTKDEEDSDVSPQSSQPSAFAPPPLPSLPSLQSTAAPLRESTAALMKGSTAEPKASVKSKSEAPKGNLKRLGSDKFTDTIPNKKNKGIVSNNKSSPGKQPCLLGFFKQKKPSSSADKTKGGQGELKQNGDSETVKDETSKQNGKREAEAEGKQSVSSPEEPPPLPSLPCFASVSDVHNIPKSDSDDGGKGSEGSSTAPDSSKPKASVLWKGLLRGPPPAPLCKGHKEPCVLRTVRKNGLNKGKQFYMCARPEGAKSNKEAQCDFFQWISPPKGKNAKKPA